METQKEKKREIGWSKVGWEPWAPTLNRDRGVSSELRARHGASPQVTNPKP